ncbi:MAG: hypothetical protein WDZ34_01310 [Candidatus Saccharimonadales bacterium]
MSGDEFTKLFKYVEKRFNEVDRRFNEAAKDRADIRGAIAELSAQVRDYHREMVVLSHQVDRMRDAIKQIAQETGVKLKVEL